MKTKTLPTTLYNLIADKDWRALATTTMMWPETRAAAPELALLMKGLPPLDCLLLLRALPQELAAQTFRSLQPAERDALVKVLSDEETLNILGHLHPDDQVRFLGDLPGALTQRLLNLFTPAQLEAARTLLGYPQDSVGRMMTPEYVAVRPAWTVAQALQHLRSFSAEHKILADIYVTDDNWQLLDALPLERLVLAEPEEPVENLMDGAYVALDAHDDREYALQVFQRYDRFVLPVLDPDGVLIGIVTVDDILDVAEAEFTEDFQRFGALEPTPKGYWQTSFLEFYKSRVGWLAALVLVSLLSSGVIAAFEDTLSQLVVLSFFIPLLMGAGGNTGSQSATITIRALSTGELSLRDGWRVSKREILMGLVMGLSLGLLGFCLGVIQGGGLTLQGLRVGAVIFLSMTLMLTVTNLLGTLLPFVLTRLRLDPASASGPMIASISDTIGLLIYFNVARLLLQL